MRKSTETEEESTEGVENQLWIATRPQNIEGLMQIFDKNAYKLLPFDDEKKKNYIKHILTANISENKDIEADTDTEIIFKSLKVSNSSDYNIDNPLMIKMITEYYVETKATLSTSNLYSFYDKMIDQKAKTTNKKKLSVNHDTEKRGSKLTVWNIHQMFALNVIFSSGFKDISSGKRIETNEFLFFKKWQYDKKFNWTPEAISRHGFINLHYLDMVYPDFVHRTFAEYFVTEFLIHEICKLSEDYDDMRKNEIEMRLKLLLSPEMRESKNLWRFIESYLESNENKRIIESKKDERKLYDTFYELTISGEVANFLSNKFDFYETSVLIKFFSIDERFLKNFKYLDGKTIFEKYFRNSDVYISHDIKCKIFKAYKTSFGSDWDCHTTHNQLQEISANDKEFDKLFSQSFTEAEPYSKKRKIDDETQEKFFKLFCFIERADLLRDYVKRFFERHYDEFFNYFSNGNSIIAKIFKILRDNINEYMKSSSQHDSNTLSHEFCNLAIKLIFLNGIKLYSNDDQNNAVRGVFMNNEELRENILSKVDQTILMLEKLFDDSADINYNDLTKEYKENIYRFKVKFYGEGENSPFFQFLSSRQIRIALIQGKQISINIHQGDAELSTDLLRTYLERSFIDYNADTTADQAMKKTFGEVAVEAEKTKMILLADHDGAGKTAAFKYLSNKLREIYPTHWISYIDLKRHLRVFDKYERNFEVSEVLLEILLITDEDNAEIFKKLFNSDKVILLYDGVDEIAPKFKDFFIRFIDSVRNSTHNQQWIATRPQHMKELREKFNQKTYKLLPFDDNQRNQLIKKILNIHKVENIEAENVLRDIKRISNENNIDSPLMLIMMTEFYVNDKTILEDSNLFSIYDRMIEMKTNLIYYKCLTVNQDRDSRDSKLSIWEVHQIYALKLIYMNGFKDRLNDDKVIDINEFQLLKRWKREKSNWTPEQISRYGYVIVDSWNTADEFPDFVHRSFAEFFVAQFVIQDLYELDEDDDDETSKNEIEMRVKLLISIIIENDEIRKFVLSFVNTHASKEMHKHFYNLITSDEVRKLLNLTNESHDDLVKLFSIDERFSS